MELYEREFFIYRLISKYQRYKCANKVLKILNPTVDILYEGQEVYLETLELAKENEVATEEEINNLMRDREMWSDYDEEQLTTILPKHIEYWKVEIFNNFDNTKYRKQLELHMEAARSGLADFFRRKHIFDHYTQHGIATFARHQRIVEMSTVNMDGSQYDWSEASIYSALDFISKNTINENIIRDLARNEPWKSMWIAGKKTNNLFILPASELSDEQRRLVNWSGLYDSVSEYTDSPSEEIFNHDDAFDGWLILKNREQEKTRSEEKIKKRSNHSNDAPEVVMVMTDVDKDNPEKFRKEVYGMNDPTSRMIVNNRLSVISKADREIKDTDFADIQRDITRGVGNIIKGHR